MTTQAGATAGAGAIAPWFQVAQALVAANGARWNSRFAARQTMFQNDMSRRQMAVDNANAKTQHFASLAAARAQYTVASAQAAAENGMRAARNQTSNAQADLANFATSMNNQRMLEAAGEAHNAAALNRERMTEQLQDQSIEGKIAAAEMAGAFAASVAMAGVGGGSVDMISQAQELKDQRREFYQDRNAGYADYDALQQLIGIMPQAMQNFDTRVALPNIDTGVTIGPLPVIDTGPPVPGVAFQQNPGTTYGNIGTDILAWFTQPDNAASARIMGDQVQSWFKTDTRPSWRIDPTDRD